jgi:Xaa-Pro aminopeptidase
MLKLENCRRRQQRLLEHMQDQELELVVLANPKTIYYFSGVLVDPSLPHVFAMQASGRSLLCTSQEPAATAADDVCVYTPHSLERPFNRSVVDEELDGRVCQAVKGIPAGAGSVALEYEFIDFRLGAVLRALSEQRPRNITPVLDEMRRVKDADELECIRAVTVLVEAGFAAIKARLEPGMTEYQAHSIIYEAMVNQAQTSLELKGDFACGPRAIGGGGPPTGRRVRPGELYIFDLHPTYQGYRCDLTRTFVAGVPSPLQLDAWAHVVEAHGLARSLLRPAMPTRVVYQEVRAHLDRFPALKTNAGHHAGHGIGLEAWEPPWLTPGSDQVLQEGEVIAFEPGLYAPELLGGIRLERNYVLGPEGPTALDTFPLNL